MMTPMIGVYTFSEEHITTRMVNLKTGFGLYGDTLKANCRLHEVRLVFRANKIYSNF